MGTERQVVTRIELTLKSWWAGCTAAGTGTAQAPEAETLAVWVLADRHQLGGIEVLESLGGNDFLLSVPRYEPFTAAAIPLLRAAAGQWTMV